MSLGLPADALHMGAAEMTVAREATGDVTVTLAPERGGVVRFRLAQDQADRLAGLLAVEAMKRATGR